MASAFTRQITVENDDGFNTAPISGADTWVGTDESLVIFGIKNTGHDLRAAGLRFPTVNIPVGANILSASITLWSYGTNAGGHAVKIYGADYDNFAGFSNSALPIDSGSAPDDKITWTTAYANWTTSYSVHAQAIATPDIKAVVQEIVDRAGWASGNAMAFVIVPDSVTTNWLENYYDVGEAASYAATLTIVYASSDYVVGLFSEDEKAHLALAGNCYAIGKKSSEYPVSLAGTMKMTLNNVEQASQLGTLTFVAGDDGSTHPVFAKDAETYINSYGEMTIETPVVEGEFEGVKIHFGSDLSLNSSTASTWIQVYTKVDNASSWSASSLDLVIETSEQYIEGFVSANKNLQVKVVVDPIDTSTPNKLTSIEFY